MNRHLIKSISQELFLKMIGFGIFMGIIFPFFTYFLLDLPPHKVFSPLFFSLCIAAGITVGLCNYYLFKVVVAIYLKRIQFKLSSFRQNLKNILWKDSKDFNPDKYILKINSADTIGEITEEYNIFMTTLTRLLKADRKTANFLDLLQQKVKIQDISDTIVDVFKDYFGANGGCLFSLEKSVLQLVTKSNLIVDIESIDQEYCHDIIKKGKIVVLEEIDNLPVRFNIGIGSLNPYTIAYLPIIYQLRPVGLCILSAQQKFKANFSSIESLNLTNQAAPFLYNRMLMRKLEVLAAIDELTGLLNRRYGMKRLNEEFERAKRHNSTLSVTMLDIDNFKQLNDTYGHLAGDHILKTFAELICEESRVSEFALRYGGEEFLIIFPGASVISCDRVVERMRRKTEALSITFMQHNLHFTFSAGIAAYPGDQINDQTQLVNAADQALYQAKNQGKNQIAIYSCSNTTTPTQTS